MKGTYQQWLRSFLTEVSVYIFVAAKISMPNLFRISWVNSPMTSAIDLELATKCLPSHMN